MGRREQWMMLLGSGLLLATLCHAAPPVEPSSERRAVLLHWLRDDCGACHGMTLAGGLGSPLAAAALADKPAGGLVATLLYGRLGTAMPPWQPFISEDEARWLIDLLQSDRALSALPRSGGRP